MKEITGKYFLSELQKELALLAYFSFKFHLKVNVGNLFFKKLLVWK